MKADTILAVFAAAVLALAACGGNEAEEELEEASRGLAKAREAVGEARREVEERQAEVKAAQEELAAAREGLREAQEQLSGFEAKVDLSATDVVLFRSVQKRLLDDGALEDVAIAARVDKGAVSLSGTVPDAELRDRAVEIVRSTPGVTSVEGDPAHSPDGGGSPCPRVPCGWR
jgi:osmotically-inducible protein OsmY